MTEMAANLDKLIPFGNITMNRTGDGLALKSPDDTGIAAFPQTFTIPVRINLTVKTDSTNIRIKFGSGQLILNWECISTELRVHDPILGYSYGVGGKGKVPVNEFVHISWMIGVDCMLLLINGEVRLFSEDEPYMRLLKAGISGAPESLFSICPAWGSVVTVKDFNVTAWHRDERELAPLALLLDKSNVFVKPGESFTIESRTFPYTDQPSKTAWVASDNQIVRITETVDGKATAIALKQGIASITCTADSGLLKAVCYVRCIVPNLITNLSNLKPVNGEWSEDYIGLIGSGSGDCFILSTTKADDFIYESDLCIEDGIAAALVFRAADNASGFYCANIDISGFVKLWRPGKDIQVTHTEINRNTFYHLKAEVSGDRIQVYLDGRLLIDATDSTYSNGFFGLNVFYGTGLFQHVHYESE